MIKKILLYSILFSINIFAFDLGFGEIKIPDFKSENNSSTIKDNNISETFELKYKQEHYLEAAKIAASEETIIGNLNSAISYKNAKDYNHSNNIFDISEEDFKKDDTKNIFTSFIDTVGSVVLNDSFTSYPRKIYEGIMVNTYKGINFIYLDDNSNARVEFNRALDRQRRAKEYFEAEVAEYKKEQETKKEEFNKKQKDAKQKADIDSIANNKKTVSAIDKEYSNLFQFKAYPDFVNPFASYMAGLYFLKDGDYAKATDLFKEVYGMETSNIYVKEDLKLALKASKGLGGLGNKRYAWVIIEDGLAIKKIEKSIKLPLFIVTDKAMYSELALPNLEENIAGSKTYFVSSYQKKHKALLLSDMDKIIKTEFKKRFDMIKMKAITSTIAKTYFQTFLQEKAGALGMFAGAIYQSTTTGADLRMWTTLPKRFMLARVEIKNKPIKIYGDDKLLLSIPIKKNQNMIIFMKKSTPNTKVINETIYF